jgi:hypothetical protein
MESAHFLRNLGVQGGEGIAQETGAERQACGDTRKSGFIPSSSPNLADFAGLIGFCNFPA